SRPGNHRDHMDWAILSTDFRNGFNMASRKHIAEQVALHVPHLSKWFQWSYGTPLELRLATGECIQSEEGTCQGDPASPLWFSLNMQPALDGIVDMWGGPNG